MFQDAFTTFPTVRTNRLLLRTLTNYDAASLNTLLDDPSWLQFTDYPPRFDFAEAIEIFNTKAYDAKAMIRWAITLASDDACIGDIYLFLPHGDDACGRKMEIGYEIIPAYRKQGYAQEAIQAVVAYAFGHMGVVRLEALIMPENTASIKSCLKAGFVREGLLRKYRHYAHRNPRLQDMVMLSFV